MLAIVLHGFTDKNTNKHYLKGQKIEVTKKRAREINSTGFGQLIKVVEEEENAKIER